MIQTGWTSCVLQQFFICQQGRVLAELVARGELCDVCGSCKTHRGDLEDLSIRHCIDGIVLKGCINKTKDSIMALCCWTECSETGVCLLKG